MKPTTIIEQLDDLIEAGKGAKPDYWKTIGGNPVPFEGDPDVAGISVSPSSKAWAEKNIGARQVSMFPKAKPTRTASQKKAAAEAGKQDRKAQIKAKEKADYDRRQKISRGLIGGNRRQKLEAPHRVMASQDAVTGHGEAGEAQAKGELLKLRVSSRKRKVAASRIAKAEKNWQMWKGLKGKMDRIKSAEWWAKNGIKPEQAKDPKALATFVKKLDKKFQELG